MSYLIFNIAYGDINIDIFHIDSLAYHIMSKVLIGYQYLISRFLTLISIFSMSIGPMRYLISIFSIIGFRLYIYRPNLILNIRYRNYIELGLNIESTLCLGRGRMGLQFTNRQN